MSCTISCSRTASIVAAFMAVGGVQSFQVPPLAYYNHQKSVVQSSRFILHADIGLPPEGSFPPPPVNQNDPKKQKEEKEEEDDSVVMMMKAETAATTTEDNAMDKSPQNEKNTDNQEMTANQKVLLATQNIFTGMFASVKETMDASVKQKENNIVGASVQKEENSMDASVQKDNSMGGGNNDDPTKVLLMQVGLGVVGLFLAYQGVFMLMDSSVDMASNFGNAVTDEVAREAWHVLQFVGTVVWTILVYLWEALKVIVPFVATGVWELGKAAAPVVQEASQTALEVATPVVVEAAQKVGETATPLLEEAARATSPLLDQASQTIDSTIVTPLSQAATQVMDQNVITPLQQATDSVTTAASQAVDATVQEATNSVKGAASGAVTSFRNMVQLKMGQ